MFAFSPLSLIQEIGFDIVSMWGQMGFLAKLVIIFAAALVVSLVVFLAVFAISKITQGRHPRT